MCSPNMMDANKELLINYVRDVKAIWDKSHPHHHNVHILARHWKAIAAELGKPEKEVRMTWKNLRQEFGKQLRKYNRTRNAADVVCLWPFYDAMDFLTDQFKPKEMIKNMDTRRDESQNGENPVSDEAENEMSCPSPQSPAVPLSQFSTTASGLLQRKTQQTVIGETHSHSIEKEKLDLRQSKVNEREDDHLFFLKSLAPQMRKLDPQKNMLFRTEMQGRLYQLLYNDLPISKLSTGTG